MLKGLELKVPLRQGLLISNFGEVANSFPFRNRLPVVLIGGYFAIAFEKDEPGNYEGLIQQNCPNLSGAVHR